MPARERPMPHQPMVATKKRAPPTKNKRATGPKQPLPALSFGHGINTAKFATEQEVAKPRY